MVPAAVVLALALIAQVDGLLQADGREILTAIRIQGNVATSDDEVRRLSGIEIGMAVGAGTAEEVAGRLRATKRFDRVEVRKRFASIADPTQIVLVIIVDEGPVRIELTGDPNQPTRVVRSRRLNMLFLPIINVQDGYGITYGARLAVPDVAGPHSRLSFPLTWGGQKRAAVELDKRYVEGTISRVLVRGSFGRQTNPFYEQNEDRWQTSLRVEHDVTTSLRISAIGGWQRVSFLGEVDSIAEGGAEVLIDTRLDPVLARDAVYVRAGWNHLRFGDGGANRTSLDARAYIGLVGQPILAVRGFYDGSDRSLPPAIRPILGGTGSLRGFRTGSEIGDKAVGAGAEVIVPLNSPLRFGKFGVAAFVDAASLYNVGESVRDQKFQRGVGGSVWFAAAFVRMNVSVAHGIGGETRVHVGGNLSF